MDGKGENFIVPIINPISVEISFEIVLKSFYYFVIVDGGEMKIYKKIVKSFNGGRY